MESAKSSTAEPAWPSAAGDRLAFDEGLDFADLVDTVETDRSEVWPVPAATSTTGSDWVTGDPGNDLGGLYAGAHATTSARAPGKAPCLRAGKAPRKRASPWVTKDSSLAVGAQRCPWAPAERPVQASLARLTPGRCLQEGGSRSLVHW